MKEERASLWKKEYNILEITNAASRLRQKRRRKFLNGFFVIGSNPYCAEPCNPRQMSVVGYGFGPIGRPNPPLRTYKRYLIFLHNLFFQKNLLHRQIAGESNFEAPLINMEGEAGNTLLGWVYVLTLVLPINGFTCNDLRSIIEAANIAPRKDLT